MELDMLGSATQTDSETTPRKEFASNVCNQVQREINDFLRRPGSEKKYGHHSLARRITNLRLPDTLDVPDEATEVVREIAEQCVIDHYDTFAVASVELAQLTKAFEGTARTASFIITFNSK
jgi:hypothetical protein